MVIIFDLTRLRLTFIVCFLHYDMTFFCFQFLDNSSVCKEKFCSWALDFNPKVFGGLEAWLHEKFTGQEQKGHFHVSS